VGRTAGGGGGGGEDSCGGGTHDDYNQCGDRHGGEDSCGGGIRGDGEGASYGANSVHTPHHHLPAGR